MDSHYSVELTQAFVIGEDELKKLVDLITDRIGKVEVIRADCADDITRNFKTVKELAGFENAKGKEIRRLHITAHSDDFEKRATVNFSNSHWRGISLDFEARDDAVSRLKADVLDIIGGMQPWYGPLYHINFFMVTLVTSSIMAILSFAFVFALVQELIRVRNPKEENRAFISEITPYVGVVSWVYFIGAITLGRFRDTAFPRAVFNIGQGVARFKHAERIQWGVGIAFAVSLLAGLVIFALEAFIR